MQQRTMKKDGPGAKWVLHHPDGTEKLLGPTKKGSLMMLERDGISLEDIIIEDRRGHREREVKLPPVPSTKLKKVALTPDIYLGSQLKGIRNYLGFTLHDAQALSGYNHTGISHFENRTGSREVAEGKKGWKHKHHMHSLEFCVDILFAFGVEEVSVTFIKPINYGKEETTTDG